MGLQSATRVPPVAPPAGYPPAPDDPEANPANRAAVDAATLTFSGGRGEWLEGLQSRFGELGVDDRDVIPATHDPPAGLHRTLRFSRALTQLT